MTRKPIWSDPDDAPTLTKEFFDTAEIRYGDKRIPLISGDEHEALTAAKKHYSWRAGQRKSVNRGYWQRFRQVVRRALRRETEPTP